MLSASNDGEADLSCWFELTPRVYVIISRILSCWLIGFLYFYLCQSVARVLFKGELPNCERNIWCSRVSLFFVLSKLSISRSYL